MISFEDHQKNVEHFENRAQKIIDELDAAGLIKSFAWSGERYCGYAAEKRGFRLNSIESTNKYPLTIELEASYWCGDSQETGKVEIPATLMDSSEFKTALDLFIAGKATEKAKIVAENAARVKAEQRKRDEAEVARLQAKLASE